MSTKICVCVCKSEREREREYMYMFMLRCTRVYEAELCVCQIWLKNNLQLGRYGQNCDFSKWRLDDVTDEKSQCYSEYFIMRKVWRKFGLIWSSRFWVMEEWKCACVCLCICVCVCSLCMLAISLKHVIAVIKRTIKEHKFEEKLNLWSVW